MEDAANLHTFAGTGTDNEQPGPNLEALMQHAISSIASLSFSVGLPTQASVAHTISNAFGQIAALSLGTGFT